MVELGTEQKALIDLLAGYEVALGAKRVTVHILFTLEALTWAATSGIQIAACVVDEKKPEIYHVYFTKWQYCKYINLCCKFAGFKVDLDGTVRNQDNEILLLPPAKET